jgi:pimeloyl-ACP methyl ester carboxylesterase
MNAEVVLVPGLWMPGAAMVLFSRLLARRGYRSRVFLYRGRSPFEANVERLARFAREALAGRAAHYIGHSLGGVLALEMLNRHASIPAASLVLLGSPVRGCYAGRRFGRASIGRWMMGASRPLWDERAAVWQRGEPLGVVAGTLPLGLGRVLGRLPGESDGVVCVEETGVDGMAARALVPLGHSSLIASARVADLAARFLSEGRFG